MSLAAVSLLLLSLAPVQVEDYYRIESADEPTISPDGNLVVFTRHRMDEDKNERRSELWLASTGGDTPARRLTLPSFDASSPRFSPDGTHLVFQSHRPSASSSIWFLRVDGFGEAFQIEGVEEMPAFSPDGLSLAFAKATPPETPRSEPSDREKRIESRFEGKIYDWTQFRFDRRGYLPDPTDPYETPPKEVSVLSLTGGEPRRLTSLGVDASDLSWSPDGRKLVFVADTHQRDERVYRRADLWIVGTLGDQKAERLTDDGFDHSAPAFSPDGSRIAFLRQRGLSALIEEKARKGAPLDVLVMDLATRETTNVTASWDLRPDGPVFSKDGSYLLFEAEIAGANHLFRAPAAGNGPLIQVTRGDRQLSGIEFTRDLEWMAYGSETATSPSDVFVARGDASSERRLSSFGVDSVASFALSSPERVLYPSKDGTEIEGWVLLPQEGGLRRPLILAIHGGPHGAYGHRFNFQFQLWAASGYAVLYTNPRGSTGYGEDFLWATWGGGWGNLDSEDVLAGVDFVLPKYRFDETRLAVTGYSYGGFLTNWVITHHSRFSAAIVGAGISNWVSDYGTADIPRTKESEFYGPPWEDESGSLLQRQSPINYVQNVVTPTLFVHGESDFRVPIEQGEQMYVALKKRDVPAKFIRYPDSYHGGWTPWNTVHRYQHELTWWSRYLDVAGGR